MIQPCWRPAPTGGWRPPDLLAAWLHSIRLGLKAGGDCERETGESRPRQQLSTGKVQMNDEFGFIQMIITGCLALIFLLRLFAPRKSAPIFRGCLALKPTFENKQFVEVKFAVAVFYLQAPDAQTAEATAVQWSRLHHWAIGPIMEAFHQATQDDRDHSPQSKAAYARAERERFAVDIMVVTDLPEEGGNPQWN